MGSSQALGHVLIDHRLQDDKVRAGDKHPEDGLLLLVRHQVVAVVVFMLVLLLIFIIVFVVHIIFLFFVDSDLS